MTALVDDLLLLARLDSGRPLDREPVDLTRLVIDAVSDAHAAGRDHRWLLDLPDEPVTVRGDEPGCTRCWPTCWPTPAPTPRRDTVVTVALAPARRRGTVELTVTDDGPGIPPELQPESSSGSPAATRSRLPAPPAAPASGWPSWRRWSTRTAAGSRWTAGPARTPFVVTLPRPDDLQRRRPGRHTGSRRPGSMAAYRGRPQSGPAGPARSHRSPPSASTPAPRDRRRRRPAPDRRAGALQAGRLPRAAARAAADPRWARPALLALLLLTAAALRGASARPAGPTPSTPPRRRRARELEGVLLRLLRRRQLHHRGQDPGLAVGHGAVGPGVRPELLERAGAAGAGGRRLGGAPLRRGPALVRARRPA